MASSAFFGGIDTALFKAGKKKIKQVQKNIFAKDLKKKLRNRGGSQIITSIIASAVGGLINLAGFWISPGDYIFEYLDKKDKKPRNGYFNGF